jgi:hypothetical protein
VVRSRRASLGPWDVAPSALGTADALAVEAGLVCVIDREVTALTGTTLRHTGTDGVAVVALYALGDDIAGDAAEWFRLRSAAVAFAINDVILCARARPADVPQNTAAVLAARDIPTEPSVVDRSARTIIETGEHVAARVAGPGTGRVTAYSRAVRREAVSARALPGVLAGHAELASRVDLDDVEVRRRDSAGGDAHSHDKNQGTVRLCHRRSDRRSMLPCIGRR